MTDGGAHVGQKLMVRIEEVGRTAAVASLIDARRPDEGDGPAEVGPMTYNRLLGAAAAEAGRRGGRRRTAATATAPAAPEEV